MTCWMINGAVYIINDKYYNSLIFQHNVDLFFGFGFGFNDI